MQRSSSAMLGLAVLAAFAGCAKTRIQNTSTQLSYAHPDVVPFSLSAGQGLSRIVVTDQRGEEARVGQRVAEKDGSRGQVEFTGGVEAWAESGIRRVLGDAGLTLDAPDGLELHVSIEELFLREEVYVQSEYDARVRLSAELRKGRKAVWNGAASGFAENYGTAGSQTNYAETLSHALFKALADLFGSAAFQQAAGKAS